MVGTVTSFKSKFGFGFLKSDDGKEIFFRAAPSIKNLITIGSKVEFDRITKSGKGLECTISKVLE